jgi:hypothetical protein
MAAETPLAIVRHRVRAPNSQARDILVVPLDESCALLTNALSAETWRNTTFVEYSRSGDAWRDVLTGRTTDIVVMVGAAGQELSQAIAIGEHCMHGQMKISSILVRGPDVTLSQISASLRSLRPWTHTLAVIPEADYLPGLLHALGA